MKKLTSLSSAIILLFLVFAGQGCSKGGGDGGIFLPDLSLTWYNKADATNENKFFFFNVTSNVNTSTFNGNENPIGGGGQISFAGSFTNHQIQFTYDNNSGAKSGKSYSGTIDNTSTIMTLTSADLGNLVLQKR
jgi:hypothetical protein